MSDNERSQSTQMLSVDDAINDRCPWSGDAIQADSLTTYKGHVVGFCNPGCKDKFATAIAHFEQAIG
ncbi:glutathione S-transferase [Alphaproteobacteria bacterium]|nr:glutathione S-transferase [Alphaproteobacteria bacterium]